MKIFLFYNSFLRDIPDGNTHQIRTFINEARARGNLVKCFEPAGSFDLLKKNGIRSVSGAFVQKIEKLSLGGFSFRQVLKDADIVIMQAELHPSFLQAIVKAKKEGLKFLLFLHDRDGILLNDPFIYNEIEQSIDAVLHRVAGLRKSEKRFFYFEEAVDSRLFYQRKNTDKAWDFAIMANKKKGRKKKIDSFLESRPVARELVLLGDGKFNTSGKNIHRLGWLENHRLPGILSSASVFLDFPPKKEKHGIRLPVLEAAACGSSVISLHENYLLKEGNEYLYVKDPQDMADAARELNNSRVLKTYLSENLQRKINRFYTGWHRYSEFEQIVLSVGRAGRVYGAGNLSVRKNIQGWSVVS